MVIPQVLDENQSLFFYFNLFIYFFFFNEIDVRRRYTGKVHPLKAWIGPSIVKRRREFYGVGVEGVCGCGS